LTIKIFLPLLSLSSLLLPLSRFCRRSFSKELISSELQQSLQQLWLLHQRLLMIVLSFEVPYVFVMLPHDSSFVHSFLSKEAVRRQIERERRERESREREREREKERERERERERGRERAERDREMEQEEGRKEGNTIMLGRPITTLAPAVAVAAVAAPLESLPILLFRFTIVLPTEAAAAEVEAAEVEAVLLLSVE
jgi:hypothetical protein